MQPPTSTDSRNSTYVPLRIQLEQLRNAAQYAQHTKPFRHSERLREQIKTWSESMTPEQKARRFTTEEIERLAGLLGKHSGRAAHHHIAQALRTLGFQPCRDWTVAGRNRRFWKFSGELK
jgi:hypothetical protein